MTLPLVVPTVGILAFSGTAGAPPPPPECTNAHGNVSGAVTVRSCDFTNLRASGAASAFETTGQLTWSHDQGVTTIEANSFSQDQVGGTSCKRGWTEYAYSGSVTADTGPGKFAPGDTTVTAEVCVDSSGNFKVARGGTVLFFTPGDD